jgi:hypothetical protein
MSTTPANTTYQHVAVAFQGGGALGAYHIGAYQALHAAGYRPDLVSGISIGAFTAAIIAENEPDDRVRQLQGFWEAISWPDIWAPFQAQLDMIPGMGKLQSTMGFLQAATFGQPHFFVPRIPTYEMQPALPPTLKSTSYYDTSPHTLVFMLDLFNPIGEEPENMDEVTIRQTEILYASRTAHNINQVNHLVNQAHRLSQAGVATAEEVTLGGGQEQAAFKYGLPAIDLSRDQLFDIVHATLSPPADQKVPHGDADFSRASLSARAQAGLADMSAALSQLDDHFTRHGRQPDTLGSSAGAGPLQSRVFRVGPNR